MDEQATAKRFKKLNEELEEKTIQLEEAVLRDKLTGLLVGDKRFRDLERALGDEAFRNELLIEYNLMDKKH